MIKMTFLANHFNIRLILNCITTIVLCHTILKKTSSLEVFNNVKYDRNLWDCFAFLNVLGGKNSLSMIYHHACLVFQKIQF